jgi:hypothetical protein
LKGVQVITLILQVYSGKSFSQDLALTFIGAFIAHWTALFNS